jgi:hypothetical protein
MSAVSVLIAVVSARCDGKLPVAILLYIGIPNNYVLRTGTVIEILSIRTPQ